MNKTAKTVGLIAFLGPLAVALTYYAYKLIVFLVLDTYLPAINL